MSARPKTIINVSRPCSCPKLHRIYGVAGVNNPALVCMHPKTTTGKCAGYPELTDSCPGVGCDVWTRWEILPQPEKGLDRPEAGS